MSQYRDQTCYSMRLYLLDPKGGVETRARVSELE